MKLLNRLCSILTFLPLIASALLLPLMPQQIPAHYNLARSTAGAARWNCCCCRC